MFNTPTYCWQLADTTYIHGIKKTKQGITLVGLDLTADQTFDHQKQVWLTVMMTTVKQSA